MLRNLVVQCNLDPPGSVFTSQSQLDKCIHSLVRSARMSGAGDDPQTQGFLSRLYDFRKKIEIERSKQESIVSTLLLDEGQALRVLVAGIGIFNSQVKKVTTQNITISFPKSTKHHTSVNWKGTEISVYFWREDDAGYVFDTEVLDEILSTGVRTLKIAHSKTLFRTQKRNSVRAKLHRAAFLYLVPPGEASHILESEPGLKCFLEDISDTGCAVTVGGKAESGKRVKVQFAMDNAPVCMTGKVRSVNYAEDSNRSTLRIEAEQLPVETRIHILGEIFGMQKESDDDDLPYRILDREAATGVDSVK